MARPDVRGPESDDLLNQSLMEETGLGLLPGITPLALVVFAMAVLLTGSMWAVAAVLVLIGVVTASILTVVVALIDESERGTGCAVTSRASRPSQPQDHRRNTDAPH